MTITERIEETPLSLALQGEQVDVADIEAWHRVNTFSMGTGHSPHYLIHAALHQMREAEKLASMVGLTAEHKRDLARAMLTGWQESGRDMGANACLHRLEE